MTYICQYFWKTEDHCSQAIKQAAKEVFENNNRYHDIMKTIAKAYWSYRVFCSIDSLPSFARIDAKENLFGCVFD